MTSGNLTNLTAFSRPAADHQQLRHQKMDVNRQPFGRAGMPRMVLQPPQTARPQFPCGPFGAELRPGLIASRRGRYAEHLCLGLLAAKPDLDGYGGTELQHPAYARQPVTLADRSRSQFAISHPVRFEILDCPDISMLGLFNENDELEAFGVMRAYRTAACRPSRLEFPSFHILIKRVARSGA